jgi:hypothetical protein
MSFNAIDSGAVMKELLRLPWKEEEEEEEEDVIEGSKFLAVRGPSVVSLVATRQPIRAVEGFGFAHQYGRRFEFGNRRLQERIGFKELWYQA